MQTATFFATTQIINAATSPDQIVGVLRNVAEEFGFAHFIVSGLPPRGTDVLPFVMVEDWPSEWHRRYFSRDYAQFDPVARHCFRTMDPFAWDEAPVRADDVRGRRVMDEATEFGLANGFCVPVHTADGSQGCVSFGGDRVELDPADKLALHMIAIYAHGRLRKFYRRWQFEPIRRLSPREIEILQWTSQGKTSSDVADLLGVAEITIVKHISSAQRKLGTLNRVHTVTEAIRYNLISL